MHRLAVLVMSLAVTAGLVSTRPVEVMTVSREAPLSHIAVIGDSYTTGTNFGGLGGKGWPARAWQVLARQGKPVTADVASEVEPDTGPRRSRQRLRRPHGAGGTAR